MDRKEFLSALGAITTAGIIMPSALTASSASSSLKGKKIKVGIIGCGSVSNMYLPHLKKCSSAEVVSVCDIKFERAEFQGQKFNIPNVYSNIDELLAGVPFDLLINLTDMQVHGALNRKAILAKKYVWSEKPMANTYEEGRALYEFALRQGVRIWGAPAVVNSPQFSFMYEQIKSGKLGRIAAAHAHYGHEGPNWSAFFFEEGGGSLPDLGVYNISTLTGLFGPVKSVVAMTSVVTPIRNSGDKGSIQVVAEDNAMLLMEHQNNIISHIQCGFNYYDPYGHEGTGQEKPTISVMGSHGNMHMRGYDWKPSGVEMTITPDQKSSIFATDDGGYRWEEGASVICECLSKGKDPRINPEHTLHVLEIIEAARKSQAEGRRIYLKSAFELEMNNAVK